MSDTAASDRPCPVAGCDARARLAAVSEVFEGGAYIWSCSNGHHGPRVIGR